MKTGIEEIAEERAEQIGKHGRSQEHDQRYVDGELGFAAIGILTGSYLQWPWEPVTLYRYKNRSPIDRLRIAGALLAAEIDRLKSLENGENTSDGGAHLFNRRLRVT